MHRKFNTIYKIIKDLISADFILYLTIIEFNYKFNKIGVKCYINKI